MNPIRVARKPIRRLAVLGIAFTIVTTFYFVVFRLKDSVFSHSSRSIITKSTPIESGMTILQFQKTSDHLKVHSKQACVHPQLELWPPSLKKYFKDPPPLKCNSDPNWVYVDNGTFRILPEAIQRHGNIVCDYIPVLRGSGDNSVLEGKKIKNIKSGSKISTDFFMVRCSSDRSHSYSNLHCAIAYNKKLHTQNKPLPKTAMGLNILMFGFDSVSRMTWIRNLPKSHSYFMNELGGILLEGYNIVGDGTPQALLPILTGQTEPELPEARRGRAGAKTVDGHPWIWNDLKKLGYVTQWGEDGAGYGTFNYRMLGFKDPPVDYFMRPFQLQADKLSRYHKRYCLGSIPRHLIMLNWIKDFFHMYPNKPKFSFLFHSEYTHGGYSEARVADDDLKNFLQYLEKSGHLNKTVLILMADHGARFQQVRQSVQGKHEERMPYFSFRFPPWFTQKYPQALENLRANAHKLTTPFDIHETFRDIIDFTGAGKGNIKNRGISLFKEIPKERTCQHAGVEPHWCACLNWQKVDVNDAKVKEAVASFVNALNVFTKDNRNDCEILELESIQSAVQFKPNVDVLKFKQSSDHDGRVADLSDKMKASETLYQITITTKPGYAKYEATVKLDLNKNNFVVNGAEISRINKYGKQPHCVMDKLPHLRPYCYCKLQIAR